MAGRLSNRTMTLIVVGAAVVAAVVVTLIVTLTGDSDGTSGNGPEAVADRFATALGDRDAPAARALACAADRAELGRAVGDIIDETTAANRTGAVAVHGDSALAHIDVRMHVGFDLPGPSGQAQRHTDDPTVPGRLTLRRVSGTWCAADLDAVPPSY